MAYDPKKISQADQQQIVRYQQLSQSLDAIIQNRAQIETQIKQTELAIKELKEAGDSAEVYKNIGGILIRSTQPKLLKEAEEQKESLELRLKSLKIQEERLKSQYESMTEKIKEIMKKSGL